MIPIPARRCQCAVGGLVKKLVMKPLAVVKKLVAKRCETVRKIPPLEERKS
jgi:hypothetical protein